MPGFKINGEGEGPKSTAEIRRVHRWVFETLGPPEIITREICLVLKEAARPKVNLEDVLMHHNQEEVHVAGKTSWDDISMTWYDVENDPDASDAMWSWFNKVNILEGGQAGNVYAPDEYKAHVTTLQMLNGMGEPNETWELYNGWPKDMNWGDLTYENSDLATVEVTYRIDRAKRKAAGGS